MMYSPRAVRSGRFPDEPEIGRRIDRSADKAPMLDPVASTIAALRRSGRGKDR